MGFAKSVTSAGAGANLVYPRAKLSWFIPAVIAIVVLLAAIAVAKWGFSKLAAPASTVVSKIPVVGNVATQSTDAAGWIY